MKLLNWGIPLLGGVIGGAGAAVIVGFAWGGWMTASRADQMVETSTNAGVVSALTPVCVIKAEREPEQLKELKKVHDFRRDDFVIEAGWVDNVSEQHRVPVAEACASAAVAGMN